MKKQRRLYFAALFWLLMIDWASAAALKVQNQTYPNTIANREFLHIDYSGFTNKPILIVLPTHDGYQSANVRMKNITLTGADLAPAEPKGYDGVHVAMQSSLLMVDGGMYVIDSHSGDEVYLIAGNKMVSEVQHGDDANWNDPEGWVAVSFPAGVFDKPPVVLASIQTMNSESGEGPPGKPSMPFLSVAIRNVTKNGFEMALERSEANDGASVIAEEIGYVAMTDHFGSFTASNGKTITYDLASGPKTAKGAVGTHGWRLTSPNSDNVECSNQSEFKFRQIFKNQPVVVASKRSRNNPDGGWLRRCGINKKSVYLVVDEDRTTDTERWLAPSEYEEISYAAFSESFEITQLKSAFRPSFTVTKSSQPVYDPVNGSANPKAIPGATVEYSILVENSGLGAADTGGFTIADNIAANEDLIVSGLACGGFEIEEGTVPSGMTCTVDSMQFSTDGTNFNYVPSPGADDTDPQVRAFKITPEGYFKGAYVGGNPVAHFKYRVLLR